MTTESVPVFRGAMLAALIALAVSVASWPARIYGSDPIAVREEARAMILHGQSAVEIPPHAFARPGEYFCVNEVNGQWYSKYGVFGAVASVPPLLAEKWWTGELPQRDSSSRVTFLNVWNTVLTAGVAVALARVAGLYTRDARVMAGFAVACLFGTFTWNYARAQSSEIVQVLLAAVMFEAGVRVLRRRGDPQWHGRLAHALGTEMPPHGRDARATGALLLMWACVAALVLTRVYFLTLLPAVALAHVWGARWKGRMLGAGLCAGAILVAVGVINTAKFGGPFLTGYHQFEAARHRLTLNPVQGLWGFFLSAEKGVWWHFPLVAFAVFGWARFWREHRREAAVIVAAAAPYVLPLCAVPSWAGNWSYGPRYLLFGLPVVSVPVILLWERLRTNVRAATAVPAEKMMYGPFARQIAMNAMLVVLLASALLNFQVNRLEFFVAERMRIPLEAGEVPLDPGGWPDDYAPYSGRSYFDHRVWGLVIWDLCRTGGEATKHPLWPVAEKLPEDRREAFRKGVSQLYQQGNWYWADRNK